MKPKLICLLGCCLTLMTGASRAQFVWNDAAGDLLYSTPGNWVGNTAPTATGADIVIDTMQNGDNIIGLDTVGDATVNSWTFDSNLPNSVAIYNIGFGQQLTLTGPGGITNASTLQNEFDVTVNAAANMSLNGGSAGLLFQGTLNVSDFTVTTTGTVAIAPGQTLTFDIDSASTYGSIGSILAAGATIDVVNNGYTGHAGDTFDLTTANFNGANLGTLPNLSTGLVWDTSSLFANGILTVEAVPEPSAYALLLLGLVLLGLYKRPSVFFRIIQKR